ncbi:hypothetical protein LFM09_41915 [Lentzea alba]|uniref:hypothetical protein n=1 Tax=Lentzea alba TaxID=2714351 RepID=UPI0039BF3686
MGRDKGRPKVKNRPDAVRNPRAVEAGNIPSSRKPRREFTPHDPDDKLVILFSRVDVQGPWCLTKITAEDHLTLLNRIRSIESMTVHQVFSGDGKTGKDYDIESLPTKAAQERLVELELDDRDRISRLQIGGKQRLYGFREASRFYAVWWDPEHEVYPSPKKHT